MFGFHLDECKIEKKLNILDTKLTINVRIILWNIVMTLNYPRNLERVTADRLSQRTSDTS